MIEESSLFGDHQQSFALGDDWSDASSSRRPERTRPILRRAELGVFVGDEERARREDCGHTPSSWNRSSRRFRRGRRLREIASRAAQGDPRARARLREIRDRLSQRAAQGDARAQSALSRLPSTAAQSTTSPAYNPTTAYYPPAAPPPAQSPASYPPSYSAPYANLPPLAPDEEYVQDVYV